VTSTTTPATPIGPVGPVSPVQPVTSASPGRLIFMPSPGLGLAAKG
jgi:hypothetical protein